MPPSLIPTLEFVPSAILGEQGKDNNTYSATSQHCVTKSREPLMANCLKNVEGDLTVRDYRYLLNYCDQQRYLCIGKEEI